jgi:transposase
MPVPASEPSTELTLAQARIAALEAELQAARAERDQAAAEAAAEHQRLAAERDTLREAYTAVKLELELLKKRLFVAKAERVDVAQLELEFAAKLAELDALAKRLEPMPESVMPSFPGGAAKGPKRPTGRRDFSEVDLPEESVVLVDAALEGKVPRSGFEVSYQLKWRRGSMVRLKVMRAKYREVVEGVDGEKTHTAERPPEILPRSLATPSLVARLAIEKYLNGMPLHRLEAAWLRDGITIDRGTMSRWLGDVGAMLRDTVVAVAKQYAVRTSFCCSTDATGVHVQPLKGDMKKKQPCRRGHFFVQLFDKAHAFFEYVPRETSDAVKVLMAGYRGHVQADAKSVYDVLYRVSDGDEDDEGDGTCIEVGCWAHARRKYWEAAIAGSEVAREALLRIQRIFEADEKLRGLEPDVRKRLRDERVRPYVEAFFEWARPEHQKVKGARGPLSSALGYSINQEAALKRFLDDGRLSLDNNASERALRTIATGRKAWLFVGSDDAAQSAGAFFSLIASCKLHGLEPEAYLRDLLRVLPHWPKDRHLELAPLNFAATRARLVPEELEAELGPITVPAAA